MNNKIILIAILVLALAVRIGIGIFLGFNSGPDQAACGADSVEFEHMAWSAAQGEGFRLYDGGPLTAFRAPGYPLLLAFIYKISGRVFWLNRVMLSLFGVATCWLVYILSRRLRLGDFIALSAAFITAVLPLQFYWCGHFMSEPISAFMNVAICLLLVIAWEKKSLWLYFVSGVITGMAALVRAACMLLPVMYGILMLVARRVKLSKLILFGLLLVAGIVVAIAPWVMRNKIVLDRIVLVSTNGGSTFWGANNDIVAVPGKYWGDWISTTRVDPERKKREVWTLSNEADQDKKEWQIGKEYVRNNLRKMPLLEVGKFWLLLKPFPNSANKIYVTVTGLGWIILLPLVIIGMIIVFKDKENRGLFIPVNAQILTLLVTTAIFYGSERFRMPYEPLLAIYAALAVGKVVERIKDSPSPAIAGYGGTRRRDMQNTQEE